MFVRFGRRYLELYVCGVYVCSCQSTLRAISTSVKARISHWRARITSQFIRIYVAEWGIRMHDIICHIKFHRHRDRTLRTRQIITATMRGSTPWESWVHRLQGSWQLQGKKRWWPWSMRGAPRCPFAEHVSGAPLCPFAEHVWGSTVPFCRAHEGLHYALLQSM